MSRIRSRLARALPLLALLPLAASAHVGADGGTAHAHLGFIEGLAHPFTGLDHLAAMVVVGLWSASAARGGRDALWAPLGFAGLLLAGALAGLAGLRVPAVEPMIAASLLVIGLLATTRLRLPGPVAAALVGGFAIFHGAAHGLELAGDGNAASALAGMVLATMLLHAVGLGLGWTLRRRGVWLARAIGATVALFGATLLTQFA